MSELQKIVTDTMNAEAVVAAWLKKHFTFIPEGSWAWHKAKAALLDILADVGLRKAEAAKPISQPQAGAPLGKTTITSTPQTPAFHPAPAPVADPAPAAEAPPAPETAQQDAPADTLPGAQDPNPDNHQ